MQVPAKSRHKKKVTTRKIYTKVTDFTRGSCHYSTVNVKDSRSSDTTHKSGAPLLWTQSFEIKSVLSIATTGTQVTVM